MAPKRKQKDELAARKAQLRATESTTRRSARLAADAARHAAARGFESPHEIAARRADDAARHAQSREAETQQ